MTDDLKVFVDQYIRGPKIVTPYLEGSMVICRMGQSTLSGKLGEKLSGDKYPPTIFCGVYYVISLMGQMVNMQSSEGVENRTTLSQMWWLAISIVAAFLDAQAHSSRLIAAGL